MRKVRGGGLEDFCLSGIILNSYVRAIGLWVVRLLLMADGNPQERTTALLVYTSIARWRKNYYFGTDSVLEQNWETILCLLDDYNSIIHDEERVGSGNNLSSRGKKKSMFS